ncbi:hypothetical protein [Macrococcoides caseolyticum]|uniref:hypothetical protein n=1 Tax=Macrococcoides caseolyticum TaxID=69966 RepID=UPI003F616A51
METVQLLPHILWIIYHFCKTILCENLIRVAFHFIFTILTVYILFDFFVINNRYIIKFKNINKVSDTEWLCSLKILSYVTLCQWFVYLITLLLATNLSDAFSLLIPLLYTYIFDNLYSIAANAYNINESLKKHHLDLVKVLNILLIIVLVIGTIINGSVFDSLSKRYDFVYYYLSFMASFSFSYLMSKLMMSYTFNHK